MCSSDLSEHIDADTEHAGRNRALESYASPLRLYKGCSCALMTPYHCVFPQNVVDSYGTDYRKHHCSLAVKLSQAEHGLLTGRTRGTSAFLNHMQRDRKSDGKGEREKKESGRKKKILRRKIPGDKRCRGKYDE